MAYTTAAKVRKLLLGIDSTVMDNDDVTAQIVNADAEIDGYVGSIYALPFAATPALIEKLSGEIASYLILRTEFTHDAQNVSEHKKEYEKAIKTLEEIRDGKRILFDSTHAELARNGNRLSSNTKDYNPTFDMAEPENQNVDTRLIDDIETARDAED